MKRRYVIRPLAEEDLIESALYIADDNLEAVERFTFALEATIEELCRMPEIGSPQVFANPELTGLRVWPISGFEKFLLYYIPHEDWIDIVRILHSARDRERLFSK